MTLQYCTLSTGPLVVHDSQSAINALVKLSNKQRLIFI